LLCGEGFGFLLGVKEAKARVAGLSRSAALAAVSKGEGTQAGTILFTCGRKTIFVICGRKTANGAIGGHGSLQKRRI
jgi:hypothetical protein